MAQVKDLFDHQVHIGHRTDRWNPKMRPFLYPEKVGGAHIFDLDATMAGLEAAQKFLAAIKLKNGKALFVGTKPQVSMVLRDKIEGKKHFYIDGEGKNESMWNKTCNRPNDGNVGFTFSY